MKHHPYLGVELTNNMKFKKNIDSITAKASRFLSFVKRNLRHCPKAEKERAYQTLVRPKLEYSSPVWNPQLQIEQVQRNTARFILNRTFNRQNPTSVTMLENLDWPTFRGSSQRDLVVLMYKVVNNLVAVPVTFISPRSPRYTNCIRFIPYHCKLNIYQHSFFSHIV